MEFQNLFYHVAPPNARKKMLRRQKIIFARTDAENLTARHSAQEFHQLLFVEDRLQQEGIVPLGGAHAHVAGVHTIALKVAVQRFHSARGETAVRVDGEEKEGDAGLRIAGEDLWFTKSLWQMMRARARPSLGGSSRG